MRLIAVNRYFHPDHSATSQMLSDLAFAVAERGYAVAVVTSRQRYDEPSARLPARETIAHVDVHRVWTSRFGRQSIIGRTIDYATFYISAAWRLAWLARRGDIIIAKTDPPMLSLVVAPIAALRFAKYVNWMQDIFPEVAEVLGVGKGPVARLTFGILRRLRNRSVRCATANVVIGERMAEFLRTIDVDEERIRIIQNWADEEVLNPVLPEGNELRRTWGFEGKFVVGYSGNIGRAHEYLTLIDAIELIERSRVSGTPSATPSYSEIVWLFIGGGALLPALQAEIKARNLRSVVFKPYQRRDRLAESLSCADIHLVTLRSELEGLIVPSKFYAAAAVSRPVLFIGDDDGEIARCVKRCDCGITVRLGEGPTLAAAVLELSADRDRVRRLGANANYAFRTEFSKAFALKRWQRLLCELGGGNEAENTK